MKRSKGVLLFAWLMIVINVFTFLSALDIQSFFVYYASFPLAAVCFIIGYSFFSSAVGIIAGMGLLKLKETARKICVFINVADLLVGVPAFILSFGTVRTYVYTMTASQMPTGAPALDVKMVATAAFDFIIAMNVAVFVLSGIFILFFTRRKVKEQFAVAS